MTHLVQLLPGWPLMTPAARMRAASRICLVTPLLFAVACRSGADHATPPLPEVIVQPPPLSATVPEQLPGLHNVVAYAPNVVCGGVPEGKEGLHTLAAMGIKTIVSVDGATPDAAGAEALGMHYVHLPISYDTVTPERQRELAQVLANAPQPIYMHCHHGKHRSAAALATAAVLAGELTAAEAEARMKVSGTAPSYEGLWQAVREAKPLPKSELAADIGRFPSVAKVTGMVATMAEIDGVIDLVKQAHEAGWKAPEEHPDLVATKETVRLATLFANLENDRESAALAEDYQQRLRKAIELTRSLDEAVRAGDAARAGDLLASVNKSCKECHAVYRDR